eukprot:3773369-Rhodomonas_salina.2
MLMAWSDDDSGVGLARAVPREQGRLKAWRPELRESRRAPPAATPLPASPVKLFESLGGDASAFDQHCR